MVITCVITIFRLTTVLWRASSRYSQRVSRLAGRQGDLRMLTVAPIQWFISVVITAVILVVLAIYIRRKPEAWENFSIIFLLLGLFGIALSIVAVLLMSPDTPLSDKNVWIFPKLTGVSFTLCFICYVLNKWRIRRNK